MKIYDLVVCLMSAFIFGWLLGANIIDLFVSIFGG
jgi:hypothetical protein